MAEEVKSEKPARRSDNGGGCNRKKRNVPKNVSRLPTKGRATWGIFKLRVSAGKDHFDCSFPFRFNLPSASFTAGHDRARNAHLRELYHAYQAFLLQDLIPFSAADLAGHAHADNVHHRVSCHIYRLHLLADLAGYLAVGLAGHDCAHNVHLPVFYQMHQLHPMGFPVALATELAQLMRCQFAQATV